MKRVSKIDISRWGEFKVGDLFEQVKTKKIPFKALDLPQESNSVQSLPLVAAGIDSQGRNRYIEPEYATILQNCLTVSANGANSGAVFYQNSEFSILQDAYALRLVNNYKNYRKQNVYLYLASVLTNVLVNNDWTNKATWRKVQEKNIKLPITSTGQPDWQYMESYIAELAARAHKDVSSLNQVKTKSHKINISDWKEFMVGDLFNIRPSKYVRENGKAMTNAELFDGGSNPVIVNSSVNNGVRGYTSQDVTEDSNVITYSDTTDGPDTMFYQAKPFVGYSHVKVMEPKDWVDDSAETLLYLSAIIKKELSLNDYDFTNKLTTQVMNNTKIQLPVDSNGHPNWSTMRSIVRNLVALSRKNVNSLRSLVKM